MDQINTAALIASPNTVNMKAKVAASQAVSFLRLPPELRLQIYRYLLLPPAEETSLGEKSSGEGDEQVKAAQKNDLIHLASLQLRRVLLLLSAEETGLGEESSGEGDEQVKAAQKNDQIHLPSLQIRIKELDPLHDEAVTKCTCVNNPGIEAAILRTSRLIYAEAVGLLYGGYIFDFVSDLPALTTFVDHLSPVARGAISGVAVLKRREPGAPEASRELGFQWRLGIHVLAKLPHLRIVRLRLPRQTLDDFLYTYAMRMLFEADAMRMGFPSGYLWPSLGPRCVSQDRVKDFVEDSGLRSRQVKVCVDFSPRMDTARRRNTCKFIKTRFEDWVQELLHVNRTTDLPARAADTPPVEVWFEFGF